MFVHVEPSDGGNRITDFSTNDDIGFDLIHVDAWGFGGGIPSDGGLLPGRFVSQLTNVAKTAAGRFIRETDATKLWFDRNGNDSGGLFLAADLQVGASFDKSDLDFMPQDR